MVVLYRVSIPKHHFSLNHAPRTTNHELHEQRTLYSAVAVLQKYSVGVVSILLGSLDHFDHTG